MQVTSWVYSGFEEGQRQVLLTGRTSHGHLANATLG